MEEVFIPLIPAKSPDFQPLHPPTTVEAKVPEGNPADFQPTPNSSATPVSHHHEQPEVALQRRGEQITGISIRCSCGQVLELTCVY